MEKFRMSGPEFTEMKPEEKKESKKPETRMNVAELKLTEDPMQVEKLKNKLTEYKRRQEDGKYLAPELRNRLSELNEKYKRSILEALIADGEVDVESLREKMKEADDFDAHMFESALKIIDGYNRNDLRHLHGGTGLK
jgi:predicted transcriptional regulator